MVKQKDKGQNYYNDSPATDPSQPQIHDAELFLYSKLHRRYGSVYRDPFAAGPIAMAQYIDAFLEFLRLTYPQTEQSEKNANLAGLITKQIKIKLTNEPDICVSYELNKGQAVIAIPKLPGQSQEEEVLRQEKIALSFWSSLPIEIFEVITEIVRGMPLEGREKLLQDFHPGRDKAKKSESEKG
ncbi:MAG: hypothetical protein ACOH5I_11950 [Oligoflexus sp.]